MLSWKLPHSLPVSLALIAMVQLAGSPAVWAKVQGEGAKPKVTTQTPARGLATKAGADAKPKANTRAEPKTKTEAKAQAPAPPARAKSGPKTAGGEVASIIDRTARQHGVEVALVHAVVAAESAYNPNAVSQAGAVGLMQVMPATAADYGVISADALLDPSVNIKTGVRHLKRLLDKYGNDYGRAIMAYNAGEGVVDRTNSNVTYTETLNYTDAVIRHYRRNGGTQPTQEASRKVASLRRISYGGKARRLLKKYLDPSLLSLKVRPTLSRDYLDPLNHSAGPESKPMFVLRP
jgi:soluble lytic murein transglycosylase-like protein